MKTACKNTPPLHKYEYFISSRLRNRDTIRDLLKKLRAKGKTVYYFMETDTYHAENADPEKTMKEFESTPDWRNDKMVIDIFEKDMLALRESEKLILLLPAGKSSHIEAGTAYGLGKKCIVIGEQKEAESLYLIFNEHYPTIDSFIESLTIEQ